MNIDLIAQLKPKEVFFENYHDGDELKKYNGESLIFYSLANTDLDSRYEISKFLINKNVDVTSSGKDNISPLHILLGQVKHNLAETIELCGDLIKRGSDINILDSRDRTAFQYIINMKFLDEELEPLYELWFSQPYVELTIPNAWGYTPIDLAKKLPHRKQLVKRMESYVKIRI